MGDRSGGSAEPRSGSDQAFGVQAAPNQAKIAADMEAPPSPLRSPDGLYWWDGTSWQPIATLPAPPAPPAAPPGAAGEAGTEPEGTLPSGAWQPPAGAWQPPTAPSAPNDPWQPGPPAVEPRAATPEPPADTTWQQPPAVVDQPQPQPPGVAAAPAPPAIAPPPPAGVPPPPAKAPPPVASAAPGYPPPPPSFGPPTPPPVPPPPPAPPEPPPRPEVPWPNWLPRNERSEAVVEDVPARVNRSAAKPLAGSAAPETTQVQVPAEARSSSWVAQLYPATAALNANRRLAVYAGLGILGVIALFVLYQVLSQANLFGGGGAGTPQDTGPVGTQFQQADGYLSGSLNPALSSVATAVKPIATDCIGAHSVTCRNTLEDADGAMVRAIAVIDRGTFPGCISGPVVQTRRDLAIQEQAVRGALIGFRTNNDELVTKGLADYTAASPSLKADGDTLKASELAACPKSA